MTTKKKNMEFKNKRKKKETKIQKYKFKNQ